MAEFERIPPTEEADIAAIQRGIRAAQERFARLDRRPLARGTHAKGICARAVFEVFDLAETLDEPALAARLARGLFARPGRYPAVVRFANGASRVQSDLKKDVRAMSLTVAFPAAGAGAGGSGEAGAGDEQRVDFSMNDAPTFPINDAHEFAVFMRVIEAPGGVLGKLGALARITRAGDLLHFLRVAVRGARQLRRPRTGYQCLRYWSTVPFAHGPDQAMKYSARPVRDNACRPLNGQDDQLRHELLRHLVDDERMARWDFAVQLLDAESMRHRRRTRDAAFWVENAAVEWPEDEAPFHTVGRITLLPASQLPAAECEAGHIDVSRYRFEENRPLGGINRARWQVEHASLKRRQADDSHLPPPPVPPASRLERIPFLAGALHLGRRAGRMPVGRALKLMALGALFFVLAVSAASLVTMGFIQSGRAMLPAEPAATVLYPDQGWGPGLTSEGRQTYYYTSQGAGLRGMRYDWFVNLEMPWGKERFAEPELLRRYGFLVDPATSANPDELPVGFTRHYDAAYGEEVLSITCAACHTGELHVTRDGTTTAVRVDGGQALHAFTDASFGNFLPTMLLALVSTATNPLKFNRFARRVLGERYPEGRGALHAQLREVIGTFGTLAWNERSLYPTAEGYGRTDALARISNTVFGEHLNLDNLRVGNAPVSYPPVWNIWKFDWVQYNASVSQPMARNMGEALGVGADFKLLSGVGAPLPPADRFRSSALLDNLHTIETTLHRLQPPRWQEDVMGAVDPVLAAEGRRLFDQHCQGCHGPHEASPEMKARNAPLKGPDDPEWIMKVLCTNDVGTDPNAAVNFATTRLDLTKTGLSATDLRAVAAQNLDLWRERQGRYLDQRAITLRAELDRLPAGADSLRAPLQAELDDVQHQRQTLEASIQQQLSELDPERLPLGLALSYLGTMMRDRAYEDLGWDDAKRDSMSGFGVADLPQVVVGYKPRPLAGIWATPPFLHNGSVPTIYALLSPVEERPATFAVGSRRYDAGHLGLADPGPGNWFVFDTSLPGNRNTGHEFNADYVPWTPGAAPQGGLIGPYLEPGERLAIIEHLKVRDDDAEARPAAYEPAPFCPLPGGTERASVARR